MHSRRPKLTSGSRGARSRKLPSCKVAGALRLSTPQLETQQPRTRGTGLLGILDGATVEIRYPADPIKPASYIKDASVAHLHPPTGSASNVVPNTCTGLAHA